MERLQKIIAESGYASRRKAEELIKNGKVMVNGKIITELGSKASYGDDILVDGKIVKTGDASLAQEIEENGYAQYK